MLGTVRKNRIPASGDGDEGSLAGSRREWGWCGRKSPPTIPSRWLSTRYGIVFTRARQAYVDILKRERYHEHTHTAVCRGYTCRLGPTTAAGVQRAGCLCLAAARTLDGWGRICGSTLQRTCPPLLDTAQACRRLPVHVFRLSPTPPARETARCALQHASTRPSATISTFQPLCRSPFADAQHRGAEGEALGAGSPPKKRLANQQHGGATRGTDGGVICPFYLLVQQYL